MHMLNAAANKQHNLTTAMWQPCCQSTTGYHEQLTTETATSHMWCEVQSRWQDCMTQVAEGEQLAWRCCGW